MPPKVSPLRVYLALRAESVNERVAVCPPSVRSWSLPKAEFVCSVLGYIAHISPGGS